MSLETYPHKPLTTVYRKPAIKSDSNAKSVLVFIPGNPGLIEFYMTYLNTIQLQHPQFEIFGIGHAGYQTTDNILHEKPKTCDYYDINYQIEHKYDIIKKYILDNYDEDEGNKVEIFFLAHSMGAYVVQRVTKKLLDCQILYDKFEIKFTGLICPTIMDISKSSNGVTFTKLFNYLPLITILVLISKVFSFFLTDSSLKRIIRNKYISNEHKPLKGKTPEQELIIQESLDNSVTAIFDIFKSERIIRQSLLLAQDELKEIGTLQDFNDWYFSNVKNVWSYYAISDHWVGDPTRDYLIRRYHNPKNNQIFDVGKELDAISHSFCVHKSVEFAEITVDKLREFFPNGF